MVLPVIPSSLFTPVVAEAGGFYLHNDSSHRQEEWIEVLVDIPYPVAEDSPQAEQKLFTYRVPGHLQVQPGDILSVPFGNQQLGAIAIRFISQLPENLTRDRIKEVEDIICQGFFPPTYWELLNQVATYYYTPLIQVIRAGLPPGLLGRSQRRIRLTPDAIPPGADLFLNPVARQVLTLLEKSKTGDYTWQYLQRQIPGARRGLQDLLKRKWVESYLEPPTPAKPKLRQAVTLTEQVLTRDLTSRQEEVLEMLRRRGGEMWLTDWLQIAQTSSSVIKALEQKGYIVIEEREVLRREQGIGEERDQAKVLTSYQEDAVNVITNLLSFAEVLLHGVTGSGKTEVYLQTIAPIIERGQSALILVPEIGLTPQLTDRFRARFGQKVCVYHSALSDGERYDTWRYMLQGIPQIIIGTRSAIFAPLPHLGIIILDEEHDSSFKQEQPAPCYHARLVAKWRAQLENCPLILGSATPSLETWAEIKQNFPNSPNSPSPITHYLSLPERVYSRPMPPVEIVDLREELKQGNRSIFSFSLQNALSQLQAKKQQGILFIHRRGYSTFVSCRSCGYVMECPNCDVSLSYHHTQENSAELLRCHYCNHVQLQPPRCPDCGSPYFKHFGSGTQKVEQELKRLFPELKCIRFDSDTTRTKDAHRNLLTKFAKGEADILLGTQMLTKGLDLAQVTLVGVVSADGLLHFSDYRARERAFQVLMQVAGRAGRGDDPGRVIIQSYTPEHPVIQAVKRHHYDSFVEVELRERAELNYPPYQRLVLLRLTGVNAGEVEETAYQLTNVLMAENQDNALFELLGPAPAPIMRISNRYRWHILLKLSLDVPREVLNLANLREICPRSISLVIDVDPLHFG
ncbi:MAG: hypothetical protein RLZZ338_630 [Cyanobacteriota bacterium]|jgi:primosomal protein N' (replication factor Y)